MLCAMSIAITADHRALEQTAAEVLQKRESKVAARALLEGAEEGLPPFWDELVGLGWLGGGQSAAHATDVCAFKF